MHRALPDLEAVLRAGLAWPVANVALVVVDRAGDEHGAGSVDRPFPLASVTKLFTALAVLVAHEEGIVELDEPVAAVPGATVRDLLCHAAGLPFEEGPWSHVRLRRSYSNVGYQLLGDLVEARAGFPFAEYLHEAVCDPLGMRLAQLIGPPGSGMVADARDVTRLARELRRPTLIATATWKAMTSVQYPDLAGILPGYGRQAPNPWGLGPEIRGTKTPHWSSPDNSPATFGHFGRSGTLVWVDPVADVAVVALTDRDFGAWSVEEWPRLATEVLEHA